MSMPIERVVLPNGDIEFRCLMLIQHGPIRLPMSARLSKYCYRSKEEMDEAEHHVIAYLNRMAENEGER